MTDGIDDLDLDDDCWSQLEDYRLLLIKTIEPTRITPYLRQCRVLSSEDEEQIYNDPNLVIRRRKVGKLSLFCSATSLLERSQKCLCALFIF